MITLVVKLFAQKILAKLLLTILVDAYLCALNFPEEKDKLGKFLLLL